MNQDPRCGFVNPQDCRELLVRIDEKVGQMHKAIYGNGRIGLEDRVDALEQERDEKKGQLRGLAILGGGGGIIGILSFIWHFFARKP